MRLHWVGLSSMLLLAGCSTAPVSVGGSHYADPPRHGDAAEPVRTRPAAMVKPGAAPACAVYLEKVEDTRADKSAMGSAGGRKVDGQDMTGWITSSVSSLQDPAYYVDTSVPDGETLVIDVQLVKAYMGSVYTSINSNVVVRVTYKRPDSSQLGQEVYRGMDTSINWANGDGEIARDFQLATGNMLQTLAPDLTRYCQLARQPVTVAVNR